MARLCVAAPRLGIPGPVHVRMKIYDWIGLPTVYPDYGFQRLLIRKRVSLTLQTNFCIFTVCFKHLKTVAEMHFQADLFL